MVAGRGRRADRADRLLRLGHGAVGGGGLDDGAGDRARDTAARTGATSTRPPRGCPTPSWRCGSSSSSECLLFGALITTYVLYRGASKTGPYPGDVFDIPYTSVSSFVLLASSLTMVLALAAAQKRDVVRMRLWLLTTALLGLTFVGGQVYEFTTFYDEGLTLSTNLFGTTFYVLTGFHGVHVTVGHPDAAVAGRHVGRRSLARRRRVPGRDGRAVLALRRHRVDRDLHRRVPDPDRSRRGEVGVMADTESPFQEEFGAEDLADPREALTRHREHPSAKEYIRIGVILAVLTALEVTSYYVDVNTSVLIPSLFSWPSSSSCSSCSGSCTFASTTVATLGSS